jgi:hypothetical protein
VKITFSEDENTFSARNLSEMPRDFFTFPAQCGLNLRILWKKSIFVTGKGFGCADVAM